jgi:hypothetical protein
VGGQNQETKNEKVEQSLKVKSFPSLHFIFFYDFFLYFFSFLLLEKKKMPIESIWNKNAKVWRKFPKKYILKIISNNKKI